jgi:hypothetical protein
MGIGDGDAGQAVFPGERRRPLVAVADHDPGIVSLDPVNEWRDLGHAGRHED